ncbi:peptidoglycan D,D-transpeptidase FtsI family protein [Acetomicrobium sp. UBA5826]|uniref:peptidoglycan D,D-transpeptidase FtsI family protein n=1 Tax=Acetomicrobium sp. UBA5826 TaxID=1946039 RepID=UPI00257B8FB0|nr:penicillin-binding protein 2 [Acetomicrobium sp. UBA5826]
MKGSRGLWLLIFLAFVVITAKVVQLCLIPDSRVVMWARSQYWQQVLVTSSRGTIADRNGITLALSVPRLSMFVDPAFWDPNQLSALGQHLPNQVVQKLQKPLEGRFMWLVRKLTLKKGEEILSLNLKGVYGIKEMERSYPFGKHMAHLLGFVDIDEKGLSGVERQWDFFLYNPPRMRNLIRDAAGNYFEAANLSSEEEMLFPKSEVVLTIDWRLQYIVDEALQNGASVNNAEWAAAVCMDPMTGEILAMSSFPSFDPGNRETFSGDALRNNAIGRVYEPGSVLKPIIMGIALENGYVNSKSRFNCSGSVKIADHVIREVNWRAHGNQDFNKLIINSCNVGMAQIGMMMPANFTYNALKSWGFGLPTGVELPGEEEGLLPLPSQWWGVVPANIALGQGIAVTPLQLAQAFSAIANGGLLVRPYLTKNVFDRKGNEVYHGQRREIGRALSNSTAERLRMTLRQAVAEGTGKRADVENAKVAGKTGTAQVAHRGKYLQDTHVATFAGFWPYDSPRYVLIVTVGNPGAKGYLAGVIAAPIFRTIVEEMMASGF